MDDPHQPNLFDIPPEILGMIFHTLLLTCTVPEVAYSRLVILLVCRYFRDVAESTGSLWQVITNHQKIGSAIQKFVSRRGSITAGFLSRPAGDPQYLRLASFAFRLALHTDRCTELALYLQSHQAIEAPVTIMLTGIRRLVIHGLEVGYNLAQPYATAHAISVLGLLWTPPICTSLQHLELQDVSMNILQFRAVFYHFQALRTLFVSSYLVLTWGGTVEPFNITAPNLEQLHLYIPLSLRTSQLFAGLEAPVLTSFTFDFRRDSTDECIRLTIPLIRTVLRNHGLPVYCAFIPSCVKITATNAVGLGSTEIVVSTIVARHAGTPFLRIKFPNSATNIPAWTDTIHPHILQYPSSEVALHLTANPPFQNHRSLPLHVKRPAFFPTLIQIKIHPAMDPKGILIELSQELLRLDDQGSMGRLRSIRIHAPRIQHVASVEYLISSMITVPELFGHYQRHRTRAHPKATPFVVEAPRFRLENAEPIRWLCETLLSDAMKGGWRFTE